MLDTRAQQTGSAAWILGILVIVGFIMGVLVLSMVDPFVQGLFDSQLWTSDTTEGTNLLNWGHAAWVTLPVIILISLLVTIWVETRNPTT